MKFLIDGIDRLGKSSLIKRIQDEYGYHLIIHYDKPQLLKCHLEASKIMRDMDKGQISEEDLALYSLSEENLARRLYQEHTNIFMFDLMKTDAPIIFDRTHLGEQVYAPLYRKYSGDYVYGIEDRYLTDTCGMPNHQKRQRLVLLTTSNFDMLEDDGLSFDFSKREEEQKMFIDAFNKSKIKNKVIVDVHNGNGGYKTYEEVFQEAMGISLPK